MSKTEIKHNEVELSPEAQEELRTLSRRHQKEFLGVAFLVVIVLFFLFGGKF